MISKVPTHATKAYRGNEGTVPPILNLDTRQKRVASLTPRPLHRRKKHSLYPLNRRLFRPQSQSGSFGKDKMLLPLLGFETQVAQPIA